MNQKGLGIRGKLLLLLAAIVSIALIVYAVIVFFLLRDRAENLQFQSLDKSVVSVAAQLSMQLDGDDIVALAKADNVADPAEAANSAILRGAYELDDNTGWVYTVIRDPDAPDEILFVTTYEFNPDGRPSRRDELYLESYEPLEADPEFAEDIDYIFDAFDGSISLAPYDQIDENGDLWLNGFAPVYDSSDEVVALVGVDIRGDQVINVAKWVSELVGASTAAVLIPLLIAVWFMSGALVKPIASIREAALVVEDDEKHFEESMLAEVVTRKDELGDLARIFSQMAIEVESRVDNLKAEVAQLKIEIDQTKRSQDVEELKSTDYYKKLKDTAQAYRASRDESDETDESAAEENKEDS